MIATLTYAPETNTVTVTDSGQAGTDTYRLVQLVDGARKLLTPVFIGNSVSWHPGSDGAYRLALQLVTINSAVGIFSVVEESEPVTHLQLLHSINREGALYLAATCDCTPNMEQVLCERYKRQKAVIAYEACNLIVADNILRGKGACQC